MSFMGDTYYPLWIRIGSGDASTVLAELDAIVAPERHDDLAALHRWFHVSVAKLGCYTKLGRGEEAQAIALRLIGVSTDDMQRMSVEFPVVGFTSALLQFMRLIDKANFMTNDELKPYRTFLDTNGSLDNNPNGMYAYNLYCVGVRLYLSMRTGGVPVDYLVEPLEHLTPENVLKLKEGYLDLADAFAYALEAAAKVLQDEPGLLESVTALRASLIALPRG